MVSTFFEKHIKKYSNGEESVAFKKEQQKM